jgi:hypothetical protein
MYLLLPALDIALLVFALVDIITRSDDQIRHLPKVGWIIIVILLPLAGSIIWFVAGRSWDHTPRNNGRYVEPMQRGPVEHPGVRRVSTTEQELAALEDEIRYYEAQARLKRAKEAAGEGDQTPAT